MNILVTGGAGYIGSHTCIELLEAGHNLFVIDNLCNSSRESLRRIESVFKIEIPFYKADIRNKDALTEIFENHSIDGVIHFAGLKSVGESTEKPIEYYINNFVGTCTLVEVMNVFKCKNIVFSSSATVYGNPKSVPIKENFSLSDTNPYGQSKLMIERFLQDLFDADSSWRIAILRYFNPVGAHKTGIIGEDPNGIPNNLMPYISQVAIGKLKQLNIFGGDYDTPDGTGIRDYIHVVDLAKGHVNAINTLKDKSQIMKINLGTGTGYSVLEMVMAFEKASGKDIPYKITDRRVGDIAASYTDPSFAEEKLNWKANLKIDEMCEDTWRWQNNNPNGYKD
jgi:UDP-glucose 4-epimerase